MFRKAFPRVGTISYLVHSGIKESISVIENFKNTSSDKIQLLFSVDMLNEGLHVKEVNGVILLRKTASFIYGAFTFSYMITFIQLLSNVGCKKWDVTFIFRPFGIFLH